MTTTANTKDYASVIFNSLSESELQAFLTIFADETTLALAESELMARNPNGRRQYRNFKELMAEIKEEMENE